MHVAHLLRKYDPSQWGGTETAVRRLLDGLKSHGVDNTVLAPHLPTLPEHDPLRDSGFTVKCFKAHVPVWGISDEQRALLVSVGGNLLSFDLLTKLLGEKNLSLIHAHTGNRLGGVALTVAKLRKIPFVATIHGGVLDLPESAKNFLRKPLEGGTEWGKAFGFLFGSRKVLADADAILTCNKREAELQRKKFPNKRVIVQPHAVPAHVFDTDHRAEALNAFPQLTGKRVLLVVGRIDPVKNQHWVVEQAPAILQNYPDALIVLVGSCTDAGYGKMVESKIQKLGLGNRVILTGGLPPRDTRLIGLFQTAEAVVLPSLAETFGLIIIEGWAATKPVLASRTSGALELIEHGTNGMLFDINDSNGFQCSLQEVLDRSELAKHIAAAGRELALTKYDTTILGGQVKRLYEELIEAKKK